MWLVCSNAREGGLSAQMQRSAALLFIFLPLHEIVFSATTDVRLTHHCKDAG